MFMPEIAGFCEVSQATDKTQSGVSGTLPGTFVQSSHHPCFLPLSQTVHRSRQHNLT
jgi:hypothetical protein